MIEYTNLAVSGDRLTVFDDDDITGDEFTSLDIMFLSTTDDGTTEGDTGLELLDNVTSLLLLVPTDESVKHKDTDLDGVIGSLDFAG